MKNMKFWEFWKDLYTSPLKDKLVKRG